MAEKTDTKIDELVLLSGVPIAVGDLPLYVENPTLETIRNIGEKEYYGVVNTLTATPSSLKVWLNDDLKIDYTAISDYELFLLLSTTFHGLDLSKFVDGLNFSELALKMDDSDRFILEHKHDGWVLDEKHYTIMTDILRQVHSVQKQVDIPGNAHAKQYLINRDRRKLRRIQREEYKPYLSFLIKKLVNCQHFKYNFETVWNLNIYAFLESVKCVDVLQNYTFTMTGAYSGMVEIKKPVLEKAHWLNRD